jgi:hypothetical protein
VIGVLLGLVFVGLEIRQNTDAVKGATIQALAEMSQENTIVGIENPDLREAYRIVREFGPDSLDADQIDVLGWYTTASLRVMENRFHQVQLGTLDSFGTAGGGEPFWRTVWFRGWWARNGPQVYGGTPFFDFVESELLSRPDLELSPFGLETDLPLPGQPR